MTLPDANTGSRTETGVEPPGNVSRPSERPPWWRRPRTGVAAVGLAVTYLAVATFPGDYRAIVPGLDPSWYYAINVLPSTPFRFGQDVVFTFGPLGYLLAPQDVGSNLLQAAVWWVLTQGALVALVVYHYRRHRRPAAVLAFVGAYTLAMVFALIFEYRILILLALMVTVPPEDRRVWRWVAPAAAGLAAVLLFVKFTVGLAAAGTVTTAALVWLFQRRVRAGDALVFLLAVYVAVTVVAASALIGGPGDFVAWLRLGVEIVGGFSAAMTVGEPGLLPLVALASVVAVVAALALLGRGDRGLVAVALPLAVPLFFAFRHSFVRHHGRFLFGTLIAALGVILLTAVNRRRLIAGGVALLLSLPGAAFLALRPECFCPWRPRELGPAGWSNLGALIGLEQTRAELHSLSATALGGDRLPDDWVREIRSSGGSVDAVPWEIAFTVANDLPWTPNPVLQTYHAYTPALDREVADHFAGDDAPEFLLVQWTEIDGRHPMLASPSMWRSILAHYELARPEPATGPFGEVALLRRRDEPLPLQPEPSGVERARLGEWIEVPASSELVLADIDARLTLVGWLREAGWRTEVVYADLSYAPGGYVRVRVLPRTLGGGLLLNRPPLTMDEFVGLLSGELPRPVQRFRLRGQGLGSYEDEVVIRWSSIPWGSGRAV